MIWYRPQKGSLKDAMKEAKSYHNEDEMKKAVAEYWNLNIGTRKRVLEPEDVVIGKESTNDNRVGWKDVHTVCITRLREEDFIKEYGRPQCVGFCAYGIDAEKYEKTETGGYLIG